MLSILAYLFNGNGSFQQNQLEIFTWNILYNIYNLKFGPDTLLLVQQKLLEHYCNN